MPSIGPTLTSLQNSSVKYARSLHTRRSRSRERAFLVEGVRLIRDALSSGAIPQLLFFDPEAAGAHVDELADRAAAAGTRAYPASRAVVRAISDTDNPQGIVAVFAIPSLERAVVPNGEMLVLVTDSIRDPGNLGTLLRSALGAGAQTLFVGPGTVDPFAPKVVRAGMGAHFRLPIKTFDWDAVDPIIADCPQRVAAEARGDLDYDRVDWTQASCLLIGNEAHGLSEEARRWAGTLVRIPLAPGAESLNAGIAGSVILFEAARQRRWASSVR